MVKLYVNCPECGEDFETEQRRRVRCPYCNTQFPLHEVEDSAYVMYTQVKL